MDTYGPNTRHLVRSNGHSGSCPTHEHGSIKPALLNGLGYGAGNVRVVDRIPVMHTEVGDFQATLGEVVTQQVLEVQRVVITPNGDLPVLHASTRGHLATL
jgi:hypothetical protein